MSELQRKVIEEAKKRLSTGKYMAWEWAGGPNECSHGYAAGIPCRQCDENLVSMTVCCQCNKDVRLDECCDCGTPLATCIRCCEKLSGGDQ